MSIFSPFNGVIHWTRFGFSSAVLAARPGGFANDASKSFAPVRGERPESDGLPIVFTSADPVYLRKHGPGFVESLARVGEGVRLHLHVMQVHQNECADTLASLRQLAGNMELTVSFELCDPGSSWTYRRAQFFQIRRFLRLTELIESVKAKILAVDIDVMFSKSPQPAIADWPQFDLTLQVNLGPLRPTPITCACMIIRPSKTTRKIFRAAVTEMLLHSRKGTFVDHLDERCLARAILRHGNPELIALPDNFCTSKYTGETIFDGEGRNKMRLAERLQQRKPSRLSTSEETGFRENCMTGSLREIRRRKSWSKAALLNLFNEIRGPA